MKTFSIKVYLSLLSTGIILTIIAIVFFLIIPAIGTIDTFSAQLSVENLNPTGTTAARERQDQQASQLDAIEAEVKNIDEHVRSHLSVLETITTFEHLAETVHINQQLDIISVDASTYVVSINTSGSFAEQMEYLNAIAHLPFTVIIPKIEWNRQANTGSNTLNAHYTATIYVATN